MAVLTSLLISNSQSCCRFPKVRFRVYVKELGGFSDILNLNSDYSTNFFTNYLLLFNVPAIQPEIIIAKTLNLKLILSRAVISF